MEEKFGITTKKFIVNEIKEKFEKSPDFIFTNYKGLSSSDLEKLRKKLNASSSRYLVMKNSLAKRALSELEIKDLDKYIEGEVGIGFANDIIATSKALVDFAKEHAYLKVSCAFIDGKLETSDRIKHLAMLPSKEVLIAMILNAMKNPITGFVGVLKAVLRNFVYAVSEIKKKKEGGESK